MTTIVTGGSGMVGRNLQKFCPDFIYLSSKDGDLTKIADVDAIFKKYKPVCVIHFAADVGGLYKNMKGNLSIFYNNLDMNLNIIRCCEKYRVEKLISCLSTCIFPDGIELPLTEKKIHQGVPHRSNFGYSYSKRMMDVMTDLIQETYGFKYFCIIPTNIYGMYDNFNMESAHVIPNLIHKCYVSKRDGLNLEIKGSGKAMRQFIYADDLAKIVKHIYDNYESIEETRVICSPGEDQEISIKDVVELICKHMNFPLERVDYNLKYSDGQFKKTADNSVLCSILSKNFKFESLNSGMEKTVSWFCKNYDSVRK